MIKKILAAVLIAAGLAALSVPLFYHFYGMQKTDELIGQFEQSVGQEYMEDNEREKENKNENEAETADDETSVGKTDAAMLSSGNVIGLIEIHALDLKYPVVEGGRQ